MACNGSPKERLLWLIATVSKVFLPGRALDFSAQFGGGVEERLSRRIDLRHGAGDSHFSNGDITARNPGIDFKTFSTALNYRFGP